MKAKNKTLLGKWVLYVIICIHPFCLLLRLTKYEILMVSNHGQYYSVSLCEEKSSIELDIILEQSMETSAENRKQLIGFFHTTLEKICNDLVPASSKPVPYIQCPHCDDLHLNLRNVFEGRAQLCDMKSVPWDYYQDLFRDFQCMQLCVLLAYCIVTIFVVVFTVTSKPEEPVKGEMLR